MGFYMIKNSYLIKFILLLLLLLWGCAKPKGLSDYSLKTKLSNINKAILAKDYSFAYLMLCELEKRNDVNINATLMNTIVLNKAYCLIGEKKYNEAIKVLDKAITTYPKNPRYYILRASIFNLTKELDRAISDLKSAEELSPNDSTIKYNLGCLYIEKENYFRAAKKFEQAVGIDPYFKDAFVNLGYSLFHLGKYKAAIFYLKKAASLDDSDPDIYFNMAITYEKLQDYDNAILHYSKAIEIKPIYISGFINRGLLYLSLSKKELACSDFKTACNLGNCEKYNELKEIMVCQ